MKIASHIKFLLIYLLLLMLFYPITSRLNITSSSREIHIGLGYNLWLFNWSTDPNCVDIPFLGHYNSDDSNVMRSHIYWFDDLGIDFVIISWQGINYNVWVNENVHLFFDMLEKYSRNVKACICVEKTGSETDETELYNYVYNEFVVKYSERYYCYKGKPLVVFFSVDSTIFNAIDPIKRDSRFTVITMGIYEYDDWLYEGINYPEKGFPPNYQGECPRSRQIPVIPRYDDTYITNPPRPSKYCIDANLTWLYDAEWKKALKAIENDEVDVVTISWWNEYAERTIIEPHWDRTAADQNPFLLYNKTKAYVQIVKSGTLYNEKTKRISQQIVLSILIICGVLAVSKIIKILLFKNKNVKRETIVNNRCF